MPSELTYFSSAKRKSAICNLYKGKLEGLFFKDIEYSCFSDYQLNMFKRIVPVSIEKIRSVEVSIYSSLKGGGATSQFESFCTAVSLFLKKRLPLMQISTTIDSRRKLPKKYGGKGARTRRQKSYR